MISKRLTQAIQTNLLLASLFIFALSLAACAGASSEADVQNKAITSLVPYTSQSLGISSLVPSDWAPFWPSGMFVREMPQSDPTFLMFNVIPGITIDQLMATIIASTGLQESPASSGNKGTEAFNWSLYSFEIRQGVLLAYNPDYGTLVLDVALAESDGKVFIIAAGTPVRERDSLYEQVFLPAVESLAIYEGMENADPVEVVLPERDYWPTQEWRISTPEEQGMDGEKLGEMAAYIKENKIPIHNAIIVRHGYIVLDENFQGSQTGENLKSATKSITSALVGIAIDQGYIQGVQQTVLNLFPGRQIANLNALKEAMTVEDLLTMRAGLDWPSGHVLITPLRSC